MAKNRRAFIDLGASWGHVSAKFARENPSFDIFCVEPNISLIPNILNASLSVKKPFTVIWAAAWIFDGTIELYKSGPEAASTIVRGKVEPSNWPPIDYNSPSSVPCIDISQWILRSFNKGDEITLKIDVEGAEYSILPKLIADGAIPIISRLICEWHQDRFPHISKTEHDALRDKLKSSIPIVEDWG